MDLDVQTVKEAARGDLRAFEKLYRSLSAYIYTLVFSMMGNEQDAGDVLQDVFLSVHRNLKYFNFNSSVKTWAHRIAVNTALNALAKRQKLNSRTAELEKAFNLSSNEPGAEEIILRQESAARLYAAVGLLRTEERLCVVMRDINAMSYKEIAFATKTNINTVRTRIKRAREALMDMKNKGVL